MQIRHVTTHSPVLFTLTQTFRYLNCCCNFFLYSATSSLFRRELREIFQCCKSSTSAKKDSSTLQTTGVTRTRTPSSPPLYATNLDTTKAERKKLLTIGATSVTTTTIENANRTVAGEPTNGHLVTFKT